jgi:hypothetical protein
VQHTTASVLTCRYVQFSVTQTDGQHPTLRAEVYTPCLYAEYFGWQPGLGYDGTTLRPGNSWTLRGTAPDIPLTGCTATTRDTGLLVTFNPDNQCTGVTWLMNRDLGVSG